MFRSDNFNAVVTGLALEGGYVEYWPKIRNAIANHALKVCVLLVIYTYLKTVNRDIRFLVDDKKYYNVILFLCVFAFLYAFKKCQKLVSGGLIFHLYSVLMNNLSLTSDINAMVLLFNQLDDAICLGSGENLMYRPELHPKLDSGENELKEEIPPVSILTLVKNASHKIICFLCFLMHTWPISLLVLPLVACVTEYFATVKKFMDRCQQIVGKTWESITSIQQRVWKKLSSTSRKSMRCSQHCCKCTK